MKTAFFNRLTLQKKFILVTLISIIVLMILIGFMVATLESRIMYNDIEKQGMILAETLAIPVINDLIYERLGLVEEGGLIDNYLTEIFERKDTDLLYITVLDKEGKVISHNDFSEYGKTYNDPITVKGLHSDATVVQRFHNSRNGYDALDFATPLSIGKKRWGTLKFAISLQRVEEEVKSTILRIILLTFILLIIGFGIILMLSRQFIGPITHLAKAMEKAGADMLNIKVDIKGHDELALLGNKFNSMIDRIRQAQEELERTHEKMVQSEKLASVGILAAGVAHEINNPLGALFNSLHMLQRHDIEPSQREKYLNFIREGLDKIEGIIGKLLWMAKKDEHRPVRLNVKDALNETYSFIEYKVAKENIRFINETEDSLQLFIDPQDFQQVSLNLFLNAVQSMAEGGTLKVSGYNDNSKIIIEVSDTGTGIPPEHISKIFDPFFTTKTTGEGTGLGLWLTYEIVKNYKGEISVKSKTGKGSTFLMSFPIH